MKILLLTASLPYPPHQGGALRTYGILDGLHKAGHEIALLSLDDNASRAELPTPLTERCHLIETVAPPERSRNDRLFDLMFSRQPDIARRLYSDEFFHRLRRLVIETPFDLIQCEGIEVACYLPMLKPIGVRSKLCYDAFNAEAALQHVIFEVDRRDFRRWPAAVYSLIQSQRIYYFERDICREADLVIAVSAEDADILRQHRSDKRVMVVPNGIFSEDYASAHDQLDLGEHALVFTGKMDYRPNVDAMFWFADSVLPLIHAQVEDARLYIVGQKPHARLEKLRDRKSVEITGWVSNVQPFLRGACVYVAPLRMGSGTRLKMLEAMATGCAVVATTTAASGINGDINEALIVANEPEQMASAITKLLQAPEQRRKMGERARAYVRAHYDWSVLIPLLLSAYGEIGLG
jgi:glycosyltransferase involved in cell wall biosynthesis